ncbi:hypothetical protein B0H13DRAFT_2329244 [Mycena leptocephala]|nr:hypothetical protein B0H13DRAFT_2329244 [Mycena leptocephala]
MSDDNTTNNSGGRSLGTAPKTSRSPNHGCAPRRRRASGGSARGASASDGNSAGIGGGAGSGVGGMRIGTLRDIAPAPNAHRGQAGGAGAYRSDEDDDNDDEDGGDGDGDDDMPLEERERWLAGGERSGLSVENPDAPRNRCAHE